MGDGTYQHSGLLAIRQAVAAKTRITYKVLYNDAVAMTGGQPTEGGPGVIDIARQVWAEGVGRIVLVADDPARLPAAAELPAGVDRHGRDNLPRCRTIARGFDGVSVIIYDQVCATEKRRRRKRGTMAAADVTVTINPRVCENCGDCTTQSHCIAIEPIDTEYGRKRRISPTSCNTDLSCLKGFCPSFVTSEPPRAEARRRGRVAGARGRSSPPAWPTRRCPTWRRPGAACSPASAAAASSPPAPWSRWRRTWRASRSARWTSPGWRRRTAPSSPTCRSPAAGWTWCASRPARPT